MSAASLSPTRRELLAATAAAGAISMLPGTLHATAGSNAIRQFTVNIPQEEIDELRRRIAATRWPDRETVADASPGVKPDPQFMTGPESQGVQLATMQKLAQLLGDRLRLAQMRSAA